MTTGYFGIPPDLVVRNHNSGIDEPSSAAFSDSSDGTGMSVTVESTSRAKGVSEQDLLRGYDGFGLVAIPAALVRQQGQRIVRKATPRDPAHAEVIGKKTRGVKRAFKRGAVWVVRPLQTSRGTEP